jgi:hypothetical protein
MAVRLDVGNCVVDVTGSDLGGVRWFELRKTGGGAWTLYQEGTWSPDLNNRWMGSIGMDGSGNILLAYSVSSSGLAPGATIATGGSQSRPTKKIPISSEPITNSGKASPPASRRRWRGRPIPRLTAASTPRPSERGICEQP